jgi:hypothetical protein
MIEPNFQNFFLAIAGASAALIGLLFVAVSVAPEQVVGPKALALHQIRASMALTAFGSTLVLSLIALMPHAHLGWPATIVGVGGTAFSLSSLRHLRTALDARSQRLALSLLLVFLCVMLFLMSSGIRLLVDPRDLDPVSDAGIAAISLIAIGIDRSWELVGGRTTGVTRMIHDRIMGHSGSAVGADVMAGPQLESSPSGHGDLAFTTRGETLPDSPECSLSAGDQAELGKDGRDMGASGSFTDH